MTHTLGRGTFLSAMIAGVMLLLGGFPAWATPSGQRLRTLAQARGFLIGYASADNFNSLPDATQYKTTAQQEFNILTCENAMKWANIHPTQAGYNFPPADQHVAFAQANGMAVHGHTLVWHQQLPSWLTGRSWTPAELTAVLYDHIDTVVGHYRGQVAVWDVVNEALASDGTYNSTLWYQTLGPGYIEMAFRRAHQADPAALLVYNDFSNETISAKSTAMYNMVVALKNRGVQVDGVGLQMHLVASGIDYQSFADNMARFAAIGVATYITELDVRITQTPTQTDLDNQGYVYRNVITRCLAQPACKAIQTWGFTDKYSWIPSSFPGLGAALIFDSSYNAKPAYIALQSVLGSAAVPPAAGPAGYVWCAFEGGTYSVPGTCDVAFGANGKFSYKHGVTGAVTFNSATFGDPAPGVVKAGYYRIQARRLRRHFRPAH